MAKLNLTFQHNPAENLVAIADLGIFICMVVIIMGIKLWWFKHRLSFEQTSTQNDAAGGGGGSKSAVIVPRRNRQQKYKRDKRYSQQIYESVEVHGVFRQKREDDLVIQQPQQQQQPPLRIRQLSESTSLILPPPRNKRAEQVHSTAFEDLEIATPPLATCSSSDLTEIPESNTKITLTFEEFERQFKLKELKPDIVESPTFNNEIIEIPVPPLRLSRSSSAMLRPEKLQHHLKLSQSIAIPDSHKVIEKRQNQSISRPKEDLTKLDDYDKPKFFETFGERRPTGYIKYEEVDSELQEDHEKELNLEEEKTDNSESSKTDCALKTLRTENIIYNQQINESPDIQYTEEYNFNKKSFEPNELVNVKYKEADFVNHTTEIKELTSDKFEISSENAAFNDQQPTQILKDSPEFKEKCNTELRAVKYATHIDIEQNQFVTECHFVTGQKPSEFVSDYHSHEIKSITESPSIKEIIINEVSKEPKMFEKELQGPSQNVQTETAADPQVLNEHEHEITKETTNNEKFDISDSSSLQADFDTSSWPQFEEKIETPKVNFRKFKNDDLETQISFEETKGNSKSNETKNNSSISFNPTETSNEANEKKITLNQRRSIDNDRNCHEVVEVEEDCYKDLNSKFYNQVRSFITTENFTNLHQPKVTFDSLALQNSDSEDVDNEALQQRRPTGFVRENEYSVTYYSDDDSDEYNKTSLSSTSNVHSNLEIVEIQTKVNFKDTNEIEKCTLNQRRPTEDVYNEALQQRRPTGFVRENEYSVTYYSDDDSDEYNKTSLSSTSNVHSNVEIVEIQTKVNFKDTNEIEKCTLNQRRPTGFIKTGFINNEEKWNVFKTQVNFNETTNFKDHQEDENSAIQQRRPTGYVRETEILDLIDKDEFVSEGLKQRRPTAFVRKKELNEFDDKLWQEMEKDVERDFASNYEAEFAKIRHSYEVNEADFLEAKNDQEKLSTNNFQTPLGFGKSIEDDWDNFEQLKNVHKINDLQSHNDAHLIAKNSILNKTQLEAEIQPKTRKSKVTFDFKTDERVIPARKGYNNSEYSDYDDDVYDMPPPPIPPKPMQRASLSPIVHIPKEISFFGTQTSHEQEVEDTWSAIRKHRNLTIDLQNSSTNSTQLPPPSLPKPSYRNPMAQLAVQRAKEVRGDMDGYKSRSLKNKKPEGSKSEKQTILNSSTDHDGGTEA